MSVKSCGTYTSQIFQVWKDQAGQSNRLYLPTLPFLFHAMDLFPSSSQVHEMLHCASDCSKRPEGDYITFGEFCIFVAELRRCYESKIPYPIPLSKSPKDVRRLHMRRKPIARQSKFEVFLGGSCNPTTWRTDVAIPMLKSLAITYYNPQVAHWGPELMEMENRAKQNAEVQFFVIDNQTRSVASMIEAAHIAGTQRTLILVIHDFKGPGAVVLGEAIGSKEYADLKQGQIYLQDLVERHGIPVFEDIPVAIKAMSTVLWEGIRPQDLNKKHKVCPVKMPHIPLGDKLIRLREVFDDLDVTNSGEITLADVCMAFKILTCQDLPLDDLKAIVENHTSHWCENGNPMQLQVADSKVTFDEFCCMVAELIKPAKNGQSFIHTIASKASHLVCTVLQPLSWLVDRIFPRHNDIRSDCDGARAPIPFAFRDRDVYLGGSMQPPTWRENIAIPILKKHGLTYFCPQTGVWSERLIPLEAAAMDNSHVLLFVITKEDRALAQMVLAAHYVGLGCSVVLCIQFLPEDAVVEGEKLSEQAVKDYNRGRVYLSDLATRSGVPVFDDIEESVACAVSKCKEEP